MYFLWMAIISIYFFFSLFPMLNLGVDYLRKVIDLLNVILFSFKCVIIEPFPFTHTIDIKLILKNQQPKLLNVFLKLKKIKCPFAKWISSQLRNRKTVAVPIKLWENIDRSTTSWSYPYLRMESRGGSSDCFVLPFC